ncbi:hypothetical protein BIFBRE_03946 [Bifidobacterium breve DSM 20213 = JCM 1192]|uniref:Uncharacterized protein n=1 Tax=Bifidobacterium breve DSM 20213 = JCM 1192 TaxID=518634 RepID=D4BPD7_BIFBR|nr:hypothetical protein BIFBRE_03946 [Bifidobacterium breve DSM 20213 = JCM 1192]
MNQADTSRAGTVPFAPRPNQSPTCGLRKGIRPDPWSLLANTIGGSK